MLSHLSGAVLAVLGLFVLLRKATAHGLSRRGRASLIAYGVSLIVAFTASALFHYFPWNPNELVFFKKLDHAAIFLVIAGTCTVLLNAGRTRHRPELTAACWGVALAALVLKMLIWPMQLWLTAVIYVSVGWIGAVSVLVALRHVSWTELRLLVHGAVILTVGAVVFATEYPVLWTGVIEGHELFHLMVLVGSGLHFAFVLRFCTVPDALRESAPASASSKLSLAADPQGN